MSVLGLVFAFVISIIGAITGEWLGFILGAFVGYCFGAVITLSSRLSDLARQFSQLENLFQSLKNEFNILKLARPRRTADTEKVEITKTEAESREPDTIVTASPVVTQQKPPTPAPPLVEPAKQAVAPRPTPPPVSPARATAAPPRFEENFVDKLMAYVHKFFTDGNVVVKVGMLFLIIGVGFLLKYAYDEQLFTVSMPLRFTGSGLLGVVLVFFGWRFRESKRLYGLVLQGGGIGVMYLTVFGAAKFFSMIPIEMAFVIMVALVVFSAILAILQNAKSLAFFGAAGGFLAPVLLSTGEGNHVVLFSYYTLLNLGILAVAWRKSWRELNLLGFVFTFVITGIWGASRYTADHFYTTEPFLIIFFLMYVTISVLYAYRQPPKLKGYIDGTLVFGVPVISFSYQSAIVFATFDTGLSVAFSALIVGAFYLSLASSLWKRGPAGMRLLTESFLALGVVFASLAIPLALDGRWSSVAWAMEGAALVWVGVRQSRTLPRLFGVLLQFGAGYFFLTDLHQHETAMIFFNGQYLGGVIISLSALFVSYYLYKNLEKIKSYEVPLHLILFIWGLIWWFVMGLHEINSYITYDAYAFNASFAFITLSLYLCYATQFWTNWRMMRFPVLGHLYVMIMFLWMGPVIGLSHTFQHYGSIVWLVSLVLQYWYLYRYSDEISERVMKWQHIMTFWLTIILLSWEGAYAVNELVSGGSAWRDIMFAMVPAIMMLGLFTVARKISWPFKQHYAWYIEFSATPVMLILAVVAAGFAILHPGNAWPLNYIPLVNPVDLAVGFLIYLLIIWRVQLVKLKSHIAVVLNKRLFNYAVAALVFGWLNGMLARTIHHWFDVRYGLDSMLGSDLFQAAISVLWTILALTIMTVASRRFNRHMWFLGLGLFSVVAAKLFLFDIANAGALAMAISITVVGVLAVVFGYYLSPLPPQKEEEAQK